MILDIYGNYTEILQEWYWNYSEILLKWYWNYSEILQELYWSYTEVILKSYPPPPPRPWVTHKGYRTFSYQSPSELGLLEVNPTAVWKWTVRVGIVVLLRWRGTLVRTSKLEFPGAVWDKWYPIKLAKALSHLDSL